jgi:hypothetical protein
MKNKSCLHPDDQISARWHYIGDKVENAAGYCKLCGQEFVLDRAANILVPGNQKIRAAEEALAKAKGAK